MQKNNSTKFTKPSSREEGTKTPLPAAVKGETPVFATGETPSSNTIDDNSGGDFPLASGDPAARLEPMPLAVSPASTRPLPPQLPKEPDKLYQRFLWFYQHGQHMSCRELAAQFGICVSSIWQTKRTYAWDARVQEHALNFGRSFDEDGTWQERGRELRQREWLLHVQLITAAQEALSRWQASDKVPSIGEIVRLLELASRLGRLASGMPLDHTELSGSETNPIRLEFELAVQKIYGQRAVPPQAQDPESPGPSSDAQAGPP